MPANECPECTTRSDYNPGQGLDSASLLKSARRKRRTGAVREQARVWEPHVEMKIVDVARRMQCVESWANSLSHGCCNAKQAELCAKVAGQVTQEMGVEGPDVGEPLRWAVHGGPGTGKSYVLNLIRQQLFEDILQWKQGDQFQVVTLQAVMANDLNGDTIHHAFGLNWQGTGDERISGHRLLDLSVQALRLRWLIIDEISMVSAELLARLELRCRELVRDLAPGKYAKERANARPFGGLNVILAGDLWQLPPPRGTFLGEVPWEWLTQGRTKKVAHTIHGQELVWGESKSGIQGVTQLVECERTKDVWLQTAQNEIRNSSLSNTNHAFLHGFDTAVPGSWNGRELECDNGSCQQLWARKARPSAIRQSECCVCREERQSKIRVIDHQAETPAQFATAKAIFATNAVKYHVNKLRAQAWASAAGKQLHYAIAKDRISSAALREKPDVGKEKLTWLQRHDQDCGSLYGILPLCVGMPVVATDHLDRDRGILRGCPGKVIGWVWQQPSETKNNQERTQIWNELPGCILVQFETKETWHVDGMAAENVFPVAPQKKPWYLDKGRRRPMLRVTRKQFPLAPGFAATAHAAQEGVVMDMHIGEAGDPLTAYIALTRVRNRLGLFVYRPFPAMPFQKGPKTGRELLLRSWSGEKLDWAALRAKYREERFCKECHEGKPASAFTAGRWKRTDAARVCKECIQRHVNTGEPWQRMACNAWKQEDTFPEKHASPQCTFYRVCKTCETTQLCRGCNVRKPERSFSSAVWKRPRGGARLCVECARKTRGMWRCAKRKERQAPAAFSRWHGCCGGRGRTVIKSATAAAVSQCQGASLAKRYTA